MKLTKEQLKKIINEEIENIVNENEGEWFVHKKSRKAKPYRDKKFSTKEAAEEWAKELSNTNPVGFKVTNKEEK